MPDLEALPAACQEDCPVVRLREIGGLASTYALSGNCQGPDASEILPATPIIEVAADLGIDKTALIVNTLPTDRGRPFCANPALVKFILGGAAS
jgi:hypothetical protein